LISLRLHRKNANLSATVHLKNGLSIDSLGPLNKNWGQVFEPAIVDIYGIAKTSPPDLIIDIGANIGSFSCLAGHLHPSSEIHSFEPSIEHAQQLLSNAKMNNLTNITLHISPVTCDGRDVVFSERGDGGSSGLFLEGDNPRPMKSISLECIRQELLDSSSVFIKMDCEGAEGEIILWICKNLEWLPEKLFIACEYHPWTTVPISAILDLLRNTGFKVSSEILYDEPYLFAYR
jgi:FkbM family methyltransferase